MNKKFSIHFFITFILLIIGTVASAQPNITGQPTGLITYQYKLVNSGFTVTATGTGTLKYQWYYNTTPSTTGGTEATTGIGATTQIYTPPTSAVRTLYYYVKITDDNGEVFSNVVPLHVVKEGVLAASVCPGKTHTFSITHNNNLSYQWYSNSTASNIGGTLITGETDNIYTPPATSTPGKYYYYVVVTQGANTYTSKPYTLTVREGTSTICSDADGDGVINQNDLDVDNDGIIDKEELYCDNPGLPIATTTGAGKYKTQLGFFDFSGLTWDHIGHKQSVSATYNGVTYTADVTYIDIYNKSITGYDPEKTDLTTLPDNTSVPKFEGWDINTWDVSDQPQMIKNYYNVNGTNFKEAILYNKNAPGAKSFCGEASFQIDVKAEKTMLLYPSS